ncbi:MAG: 16S rRNA pseudouridine(516) synthase, partial [Lysobacter sp.]
RSQVGGLALDGLPEGQWRTLDANDLARLFAG